MAKIATLDFAPLNVRGDNYLQWAMDIEISLGAKGLEHCIVEGNNANKRENSKTLMLIRHHIEESLKSQYLTVTNPHELWIELERRYKHQKTLILPGANYEWTHLRFQDYQTVDEYNSALFRIVSKLRMCGSMITEDELLEKTFQTMPENNLMLQQQYRQKGFKTYSELISCLLLAEKNNQLLLKNSGLRPPGTKPVPEANLALDGAEANHVRYDQNGRGSSYGRGRGRGGNGRGRGHGGYGKGRKTPYNRPNQSNNGRGKDKGNGTAAKPQNPGSSPCHRCGMLNHWAKNCRTAKHLVDLYQGSLKGKNPEAHMVYKDDEDDFDRDNDNLMDFETSDLLELLEDDKSK